MNFCIEEISHKVLLYLPNSVAAIGLSSVVEYLRIFCLFLHKNMLYDNRIASVEILQYAGAFKICWEIN